MQGKRIDATVLYADISGFTAISEKLDPEEVTSVMNRCFENLEAVVISRGGTPVQYLGDCLLSAFGLNGGDPNERTAIAVHAALELRDTIYRFNREANLPSALDIHIGVASGPVLVGELGGKIRREMTLSGETVELASRLEDASDRGQIFVGPRTFERTQEHFRYRPVDPVTLHGQTEPVPAYELTAVADARRLRKRDSERRQATVIFASIDGFDALKEGRSADELNEILNRCFTAMEAAVTECGGIVDKYIGAGLMALFGVPNAIENAPGQAVLATLAMRERLREVKNELQLPVELGMHAGINSGLVISGEIGGRVKRDFTVMGDTTNVASRLKDAAHGGEILVGPETFRTTESQFEYSEPRPLRLKGKSEPMPARAVSRSTQPSGIARPSSGASASTPPMVGRDAELRRLAAGFARLRDGTGGIVCIAGDAGLGKSRLISEAITSAGSDAVTVLEGRCTPLGANLSFHPFAELVRRWAGLDAVDAARRAARLAESLQDLLGDEASEVLPFLMLMLGLDLAPDDAAMLAEMEGEVLEKMMAQRLRRVLEETATQRPAVVLIDDAQWIDQSSLDLLEGIAGASVDGPLLFVVAYRPEAAEQIRTAVSPHLAELGERFEEIRLAPLSPEDAVRLTEELLQIDDLQPATRRLILEKAEGNPFYLEEVVRSLREQGAIERVGDRYRVTERMEKAVVPGTVQAVILSRVDRLEEPTRQLLRIASVIGRSFRRSVMHEILRHDGQDDDDVEGELDRLVEIGLLARKAARSTVREGDGDEYLFPHALAQQSIYESLLLQHRREFHLRVAQAMEGQEFGRPAERYGVLAYHFSRSDDSEKAEEYLFKAGEAAARSAASHEALNLFREASSLYLKLHQDGGDPQKRVLLEKNIAVALWNTGGLTESIEHFDKTLELLGVKSAATPLRRNLAFAADFAAVLYRLFRGPAGRIADLERTAEISNVAYMKGRAQTTSDPQRVFMDSVAGIRRLNRTDPARVDRACGMYATMAAFMTYSGASFALGRRFLDAAKKVRRPGNISDAFGYESMRFVHLYLSGEWARIKSVDEELIEEALRHGLFWDVQTYLGLDCDLRIRRGDFAGARERLGQLDTIAEEYGYEFARSNHAGMTTLLLTEERQLPEALRAAKAYYSDRHEESLKVLALGSEAKIEVLLGRLDAAATILARIRSLIERVSIVPPWHLSAFAVADLNYQVERLRRANDSERRSAASEVRRSCRFAVGLTRKVATHRVETWRLAGDAYWLLGSRRRALRAWATAIGEGQRLGARPELARTFEAAANALQDDGRAKVAGLTAAECRRNADALFAELGLAGPARDAA